MPIRIDLEDDTDVEITDMDVIVTNEKIQFSVEGSISDIPTDIIANHAGNHLSPVEITFKKE